MQDRFRFRVYRRRYNVINSVSELFEGVVLIDTKGGIRRIPLNENNILSQCTGLKDKNDKLIYEGDVLKGLENDNLCAVYWSDLMAFFYIKTVKYTRDLIDLGVISKHVEVIGNIYKNPELMEEK